MGIAVLDRLSTLININVKIDGFCFQVLVYTYTKVVFFYRNDNSFLILDCCYARFFEL